MSKPTSSYILLARYLLDFPKIVPPAEDQVFKYMNLGRTFSMKSLRKVQVEKPENWLNIILRCENATTDRYKK